MHGVFCRPTVIGLGRSTGRSPSTAANRQAPTLAGTLCSSGGFGLHTTATVG